MQLDIQRRRYMYSTSYVSMQVQLEESCGLKRERNLSCMRSYVERTHNVQFAWMACTYRSEHEAAGYINLGLTVALGNYIGFSLYLH